MKDFWSEYNELVNKLGKLLERGISESLMSMFDPNLLGAFSQLRRTPTSFDAYKVLGLSKESSKEQIKQRFRELAKVLHPDTAACPGTEFLFNLINVSYQIIAKERGWK